MIPRFALFVCGLLIMTSGLAMSRQDPGELVQQTLLAGDLHRMTKVIDSELFNRSGEKIGSIVDVVFDENDGTIAAAIISVGTWASIGDLLSPVPWASIANRADAEDGFILNLEPESITEMNSFPENQWPTTDTAWATSVAQQFNLPASTQLGKLVRASGAIDAEVYDLQGRKIGELDELLLYDDSSKVVLSVLSTGNLVEMGENRRYVVPWGLIRQSKEADPGFVIDLEKARLSQAPSFRENDWPDLAAPEFNERIADHYDVERFWQTP